MELAHIILLNDYPQNKQLNLR